MVYGDCQRPVRCWKARHLDDCDALVTLTGLDELNIIVSLYGNSRGVPQIITKLGRMDNTRIVDALTPGQRHQAARSYAATSSSATSGRCRTRLAPPSRSTRWPTGRRRRWNSSSTTRPVTAEQPLKELKLQAQCAGGFHLPGRENGDPQRRLHLSARRHGDYRHQRTRYAAADQRYFCRIMLLIFSQARHKHEL